MKSIVINQDDKQCIVCGKRENLHLHHIIFGRNRKKADEDGLTVWLCYEHHEGTYGVHGKYGHSLDMQLKCLAERMWVQKNSKTEEDFIKKYGRNYL